jgi:hypothetical protein
MGAEAICTAEFLRQKATGKARLETDVLQFRGFDLRLTIRFADIWTVAVCGDALTVTFADGTASFDLGDAAAAKWAEKIRNPPSRLKKLGVKSGQSIAVVNLDDDRLAPELETVGAQVAQGLPTKAVDVIFYGASHDAELVLVKTLRKLLRPAGALWIIRPKGRPEISEGSVRTAGRNAGLVDVKVVSFSPTHTAEKFVIPLAKRKRE